MTVIAGVHEEHGATFREVGGRRVVDHYGRPERANRAVRNVVGLVEAAEAPIAVTGDDRRAFVDDAVSNRVPDEEGTGVYALLLDPDGRVETDMYVFDAGDRLLVFVPPDRAGPLVDDWREKTFIQDVAFEDLSDDLAAFGVHGPNATEKVASVLNGAGTPEESLSFVRGRMNDVGVTVIRTDAPLGEEGYEVICDADAAPDVFDTLENRGLNAAPFGYRTWETLTLEAGTPIYPDELADRIPNALGMPNAVDFEKGCFVGQEVVSRIENRGRPPERLVGLTVDAVPDADAAVFADDAAVGTVTRAARSPTRGEPLALATLSDVPDAGTDLTVRVDGEAVPATRVDLPFVEGSDRSARCPVAPED